MRKKKVWIKESVYSILMNYILNISSGILCYNSLLLSSPQHAHSLVQCFCFFNIWVSETCKKPELNLLLNSYNSTGFCLIFLFKYLEQQESWLVRLYQLFLNFMFSSGLQAVHSSITSYTENVKMYFALLPSVKINFVCVLQYPFCVH